MVENNGVLLARIDERVKNIKDSVDELKDIPDRVTRLEEKVGDLVWFKRLMIAEGFGVLVAIGVSVITAIQLLAYTAP